MRNSVRNQACSRPEVASSPQQYPVFEPPRQANSNSASNERRYCLFVVMLSRLLYCYAAYRVIATAGYSSLSPNS